MKNLYFSNSKEGFLCDIGNFCLKMEKENFSNMILKKSPHKSTFCVAITTYLCQQWNQLHEGVRTRKGQAYESRLATPPLEAQTTFDFFQGASEAQSLG